MSTKLPEELIASLGTTAEARGVSRNHLVREALEAVVEGRVKHLSEEELTSRRLQAVRESLERERQALRAAAPSRRAAEESQSDVE